LNDQLGLTMEPVVFEGTFIKAIFEGVDTISKLILNHLTNESVCILKCNVSIALFEPKNMDAFEN